MNEPTSTSVLHFEPPGPGHWELDSVHYPHPMTHYYQEMQPQAFNQGTQDFARFYGMLIDGLNISYVNNFGYLQVLPAPQETIFERFKRAEQAFEQKIWREQLLEWDTKCKPNSIAKHRELQKIDPQKLSDTELVTYLKSCHDHHKAMITQHLRFTASASIPVGDFLAQIGDLTGLPHSQLLELMQGASLISSGGSNEAERLKKAISQDTQALELLESNEDPAQILSYLRALKNETGMALAAYLDLIGNRIVDGFDITEPRVIELPDALIRAIRTTLSREAPVSSEVEKRTDEVRALVPEKHKDLFNELLHEARLVYRLRDERGVYSDIWAAGLMRRAALAAGQGLAGKGVLANPELILDASLDEMCLLISNKGGPSSDELQKRAEYRAAYTSKNAPLFLGSSKPPPPDLSALPPSEARLMRALFIILTHQFGSSEQQNEEKILHGLAASKGYYEGPARCIKEPSEFGQIVKGDVLVTESTSEAFNILLPLLGGIITDNGGLLSHAAIVAREYGIPAVVGTCEATELITNGVLVRVDGNSGEVTILR